MASFPGKSPQPGSGGDLPVLSSGAATTAAMMHAAATAQANAAAAAGQTPKVHFFINLRFEFRVRSLIIPSHDLLQCVSMFLGCLMKWTP